MIEINDPIDMIQYVEVEDKVDEAKLQKAVDEMTKLADKMHFHFEATTPFIKRI